MDKIDLDNQIYDAKVCKRTYCPICGYDFEEINVHNMCFRCFTIIHPSELISEDSDYAWVE